mmetsp:Transcript_23143/g.66423  ORF Transcript_23143/g.66423 Transcript_23143/m.66423 type:complete len:263 (-) Transcript_23143:543-1331(-)
MSALVLQAPRGHTVEKGVVAVRPPRGEAPPHTSRRRLPRWRRGRTGRRRGCRKRPRPVARDIAGRCATTRHRRASRRSARRPRGLRVGRRGVGVATGARRRMGAPGVGAWRPRASTGLPGTPWRRLAVEAERRRVHQGARRDAPRNETAVAASQVGLGDRTARRISGEPRRRHAACGGALHQLRDALEAVAADVVLAAGAVVAERAGRLEAADGAIRGVAIPFCVLRAAERRQCTAQGDQRVACGASADELPGAGSPGGAGL